MDLNADVARQEDRIHSQLLRIPLRVTSGCIVKVKSEVVFGIDNPIPSNAHYLYGIDGNILDTCHSTTSRGFKVDFSVNHIFVGFDIITLNEPIFENDMHIMRFPW